MQTAILFFIASSVGISVGWQPMPDGSPRYEYVVQLDRELLATLKQGESMQGGSIPISSEVPDDIRPIARIRIVVGDENLPRQKLVTQFKPWPEGPLREGPLREGLVETQYVVPTGGANLNAANENSGNIAPRYQNQPILPADSSSRQILPPKSRPPSDGNSFGQALQRSAEQARNASTQGQILPPSKEIRPPGREILPPQSNGRYAEPIQSVNQKRGNQWRDTSASSQADIQQLFGPAPGERSRGNLQPAKERSIVTGDRYNSTPSSSGPIIPRSQSILPPTSSPTTPIVPATTAEIRSTTQPPAAGSRYQRLDEPITADKSADWNLSPPNQLSSTPLSSNPLLSNSTPITSTSGVFNAPWPAPERFEDAPLAQAWNTRNQPEDRLASRPADYSPSSDWPKTETTDRTATDSQWPNSPPQTLETPPPEIRREMLSHPANAELRIASSDPVSTTRASFPQSSAQAPVAPPRSNVISQPQNIGLAGGSPSGSVFPLLLAWVLLSGSGAGNLYLFWSYLDIRNKYRGLVRTAGRKLGHRSAEEEYDDYDE